jgi:hypothetical protein
MTDPMIEKLEALRDGWKQAAKEQGVIEDQSYYLGLQEARERHAEQLDALIARAREEAKPAIEHSDDCAVGIGGICDCPAQEFDGLVTLPASAGTEGPGLTDGWDNGKWQCICGYLCDTSEEAHAHHNKTAHNTRPTQSRIHLAARSVEGENK